MSFASVHKTLGLGSDIGFNLESEKRGKLAGDQTAHVLANSKRFGPGWRDLPRDRQSEIVERLVGCADEGELVGWLVGRFALGEAAAIALANASLPQNHCRLGRRALEKVVRALREGCAETACPATGEVLRTPIGYAEAAERAGYHHSDRRPENLLDALPYYGEALADHVSGSGDPDHDDEVRWGRIPNPAVHIGLGQLRALVNAVIKVHGAPHEIVVELARELKMGKKQKDEIGRIQAQNQKDNDKHREALGQMGQRDTGENRLRLRLWEELNPDDPQDRRCPYGGRQISPSMLFTDEVEIEHILPFSRTLDNSAASKTVSSRAFNRQKGNRSPHEAFSHNEDDWADILARVRSFPKNKRWRFSADAMKRFEDESGFLDRQLTDTAYLARITRRYLTHICPAERVRAIPGRLTALLRGKWGLNSLLSDANLKNRFDHRHHAIDAAVAAVTDQAMLRRIAAAADQSRARLIENMPEPWDGFRDDVRDALRKTIVSHRTDHGIQGKLHEETAYRMVRDAAAELGCNLVRRKPLVSLTDKEILLIRDRDLRQRVRDCALKAEAAGVKREKALADFSNATGMRRVRVLKKEEAVVPITGPDGNAYKAYIPGDNHHVDIFATPDGKWRGESVSVFHANQKGYETNWRTKYPTARLVMCVHKGDALKLTVDGEEKVMRVYRLEASNNRIRLATHQEGGNLDTRHKTSNDEDPFRWLIASYSTLKKAGARKVSVDVTGRVRDPGPPA
ncbi:MAG: type II CRISPR RNA-guided endonuclease Cas9 [Alphaproteobacteria bacterium]|nr:type II CRISPR RNA-guided endonuclease Cas9 [Alphaproteobacteria bacterium]